MMPCPPAPLPNLPARAPWSQLAACNLEVCREMYEDILASG